MVEVVEEDWEFPVLPEPEYWPEYWDIRQSLQERYNSFDGPIPPSDRDGSIAEMIGGTRFVSTLRLAMERTGDIEAIRSIGQALGVIVDRPHAGETAWEMRRYIRRAPVHLIGEFGVLMKELAERIPGGDYIDTDFFYWGCEGADPEMVEHLSREVLNGLRLSIDCINPDGTVRWDDPTNS